MKKRHILSPLTAGLVYASLAFGAAPAFGQSTETEVSYSNMVLNIGATELDRNFVWYTDAAK